MGNVIIRPMMSDDWVDVSNIYQAGMDTNLATFQTECPPYAEWDSSHIKECRLIAESGGKVLG